MSATSKAGKAAIARAGSIEGAIDEACHNIVYFRRKGMKNLERVEERKLEWLKAELGKRSTAS